ncbi:MAG TPA: SRPBCC family protein [Kofleriaceae bacterium]
MKPIDVSLAIGAVTREVKSVERDDKTAKVIVATRVFDTGVADVWDAITAPDRLARWFLPIEGELRVGGKYQLKGNAGGTITTCEPPRHLAVTWEFGGQVSWVEVRLEPQGAQTRLTLEHTAHVEKHWTEFGPGAVGVGWDLTLIGLYLHTLGAMESADEGTAWAATDEGKQFMRLSSEGWSRASIAAGADAQEARAAGDRTTAFYTGS